MRRLLFVFISLVVLLHNLKAQDTLSVSPLANPQECFKTTKIIAPAALMSVGVFGAESSWWKDNINEPIKEYAANLRGDAYLHIDDQVQYIPAIAFLGIGLFEESEHDFKEKIALEATSWTVMGILVNSVKYTLKEMRPDGSRRNSFPSGHTATAVMGA